MIQQNDVIAAILVVLFMVILLGGVGLYRAYYNWAQGEMVGSAESDSETHSHHPQGHDSDTYNSGSSST